MSKLTHWHIYPNGFDDILHPHNCIKGKETCYSKGIVWLPPFNGKEERDRERTEISTHFFDAQLMKMNCRLAFVTLLHANGFYWAILFSMLFNVMVIALNPASNPIHLTAFRFVILLYENTREIEIPVWSAKRVESQFSMHHNNQAITVSNWSKFRNFPDRKLSFKLKRFQIFYQKDLRPISYQQQTKSIQR